MPEGKRNITNVFIGGLPQSPRAAKTLNLSPIIMEKVKGLSDRGITLIRDLDRGKDIKAVQKDFGGEDIEEEVAHLYAGIDLAANY